MTFFLDRSNDSVLIDVRALYKADAKSATLSLKLEGGWSEELAEWLESKLLVNAVNVNVIREVENGEVVNWTIDTFSAEASNSSNRLLFMLNMVEPWDEAISLSLSMEVDGEEMPEDRLIIRVLKPSYGWNEGDMSVPIGTLLSSWALAKTNPKLTGNIKLVVTENGSMYLDTFKVTHLLADNNYRHQEVDYTGDYPHDVKRVFSSLPAGEIYKLPDGAYNPRKNSVDYADQIETCYEYGAETNGDFLYSENMKILAPLYINKVLPDFFCVFRVDEHFNLSSYRSALDDYETYKGLLRDGEMVKCFDLRSWTAIGKYLNNYASLLKDLTAPVSLQFTEQDRDPDDIANKYKTGTNIWNGISLDRGILTSKQETSYFANKILTDSVATQERYDMFLVNGFERNNLLYPNILNLEFMFNDPESESYEMHKYFGLYLKEDAIWKYNAVIKEAKSNNISIKKYGSDWNIVDDGPYISKLLDDASLSDRLFFEVDNIGAARVKALSDYNDRIQKSVMNVPDVNVVNARAVEVQDVTDATSFVTVHFTEPIHYGEHFRICVRDHFTWSDKKKRSYIYEIIASNDQRLANSEGNIFPYVQVNKKGTSPKKQLTFRSTDEYIRLLEDSSIYHHTWLLSDPPVVEAMTDYNFINPILEVATGDVEGGSGSIYGDGKELKISKALYDTDNDLYGDSNDAIGKDDEWPTVYRLAFYTQDTSDPMVQAPLSEQLKRISACIKKFGSDFYVSDITDDTISIVSLFEDTYFQHITDDILDASISWADENRLVADFEADCGDDTVSYFLKDTVYKLHPLCYSTSYYDNETKVFAPYGFELLGWRLCTIVGFIPFTGHMYQFDWQFETKWRELLGKTVEGFYPAEKFGIIEYVAHVNIPLLDDSQESGLDQKSVQEENIIMSPFSISSGLVSMPYALSDTVHMKLYTPLAHDFAMMGMLSFKDIDSRLDYSEAVVVSNDASMHWAAGDVITIGSFAGGLKEDVVYVLENGSFNNIPLLAGSSFYVSNGTLWCGDASIELPSMSLAVSSDVTLRVMCASSDSRALSYMTPELKVMNCYVDQNNISESDLQIPILVPVCTQWHSIGTYYDSNSLLDVATLLDSEFQSNVSEDSGMFAEISRTAASKWQQQTSLEDTVDTSIGQMSVRDAILNGWKIREWLAEDEQPVSTKVYYNKYTETLECIFYGIKLMFKFKDNVYINTVRLNEYNNYEIFLVNDYDTTLRNEVFISTKESIILFVNHNFSLNSTLQNSTIMSSADSGFEIERSYSWHENPYYINLSKAFGDAGCLLTQFTSDAGKDSNIGSNSTFIEVDYVSSSTLSDNALYGHNYTMWTDALNCSVGNGKMFINYIKDGACTVMSSSTDDLSYVSDDELHLDNDRGECTRMSFSETFRSATEDIADGEILKRYAESFTQWFDIYIISDGPLVTEHISEDYCPVVISVTMPSRVKFNPGYFDINLYDLVEYGAHEESSVRDVASSAFTLSNTHVTGVKQADNLWKMKTFLSGDTSTQANYFVQKSRSIVASDWDFHYYRQYADDDNWSYVNGYVPGIEDKSLFGSKCVVLNDTYVDIESWEWPDYITVSYVDSDYNTDSDNTTKVEVQFNMSQILYNWFMEKVPSFTDNWDGLPTINNDVYVKNYIKATLMQYFDITDEKNFTLWAKTRGQENDTLDLVYETPDDFDTDWEAVDNCKASYSNVNNEIILTVTLSEYANKAFYPMYKITR